MIQHIQQGKDECVLACVAMVTGHSLEHVRKLYGKPCEGVGVNLINEMFLLNQLGYKSILDPFGDILEHRVYLVTVPSKTLIGFTHRIVIDNMFFQPEKLVYDPQGTDEFTCYTSFEEVCSVPFTDVTEIPYRMDLFYRWRSDET